MQRRLSWLCPQDHRPTCSYVRKIFSTTKAKSQQTVIAQTLKKKHCWNCLFLFCGWRIVLFTQNCDRITCVKFRHMFDRANGDVYKNETFKAKSTSNSVKSWDDLNNPSLQTVTCLIIDITVLSECRVGKNSGYTTFDWSFTKPSTFFTCFFNCKIGLNLFVSRLIKVPPRFCALARLCVEFQRVRKVFHGLELVRPNASH